MAGFDPSTSSLEIRLIQSQDEIRNPSITCKAVKYGSWIHSTPLTKLPTIMSRAWTAHKRLYLLPWLLGFSFGILILLHLSSEMRNNQISGKMNNRCRLCGCCSLWECGGGRDWDCKWLVHPLHAEWMNSRIVVVAIVVGCCFGIGVVVVSWWTLGRGLVCGILVDLLELSELAWLVLGWKLLRYPVFLSSVQSGYSYNYWGSAVTSVGVLHSHSRNRNPLLKVAADMRYWDVIYRILELIMCTLRSTRS